MATADEIREQQRQTWDEFSDGWTRWDQLVIPWLRPVGDEMIRLLALRDDNEHLDIASGTGEPGLSIAALLARGRVLLTDLSSGMLESAAANAQTRALTNVDVRVCSVDQLPFADASFDSISCRFGFMFFPDIPGAVAELARVLRPGGRIAVAVWAEPPGNPWATLPMAAIAQEVAMPPPTPDAPGLWRCAAPGMVSDLFRRAGLSDVQEVDVQCPLATRDAEEYYDFITQVAAPVAAGLSSVPAAAGARIRAATIAKVRDVAGVGGVSGVRLPSHARCIAGTR